MKRNDLILLTATLLYSFLFFKELPGLNILLFSVAVVALLILKTPAIIKEKRWLLAATGTLVSGVFVLYNASTIAFMANLLSLALLSCLSVNKRSSVFMALAFSFYSACSSFVYMILDAINRMERIKKEPEKGRGGLVKPLIVLVTLLIAVLFFLMYQASNVVYEEVTKDIKFDFLTAEWVAFTLFGFLLLYGFLYHRNFEPFASNDALAPNKLDPMNTKTTFWDKVMTAINENFSGIMLLGLLNLVLLSVNVVDVVFLYSGMELPEGVTPSESVHQGVGVLIMSIVFAISIILYYFRGRMNFYPNNRVLRLLAFIWIAQNAFMVVSTGLRNHEYIMANTLTFKRIGVYVWLLLTLIGLVVTFIKVGGKRSNWFLVRTSGWAYYAVLLVSCMINWNVLITNYNISQSEKKNTVLDVDYLVRLDHSNIPQLIDWLETHPDNPYFEEQLYYKIERFKRQWNGVGWKSWCASKQEVYNDLVDLEDEHTLLTLYATYGKRGDLSLAWEEYR